VNAEIDHLVIAARSLDDGVAWCEATLGIAPGAGGAHPLMGTHNRLFALGARAYAEIIAIDPHAPPPERKRWFDLDHPDLLRSIARTPRLVHWVARAGDLDAALAALAALGIDAGRALAASRESPRGTLRWRIAVRDDGVRPLRGALPALIEWGPLHPSDALPASGVELRSLALGGDAALADAVAALGLRGVEVRRDAPPLEARLATPRGEVRLTIAA